MLYAAKLSSIIVNSHIVSNCVAKASELFSQTLEIPYLILPYNLTPPQNIHPICTSRAFPNSPKNPFGRASLSHSLGPHSGIPQDPHDLAAKPGDTFRYHCKGPQCSRFCEPSNNLALIMRAWFFFGRIDLLLVMILQRCPGSVD